MKTLLEEVDMRIEETKKGTHDFKREIIIAAENPKTGKTSSEKFIKCVTPLCTRVHTCTETHAATVHAQLLCMLGRRCAR